MFVQAQIMYEPRPDLFRDRLTVDIARIRLEWKVIHDYL